MPSRFRSVLGIRLACVAVTLAALLLVFHRVQLHVMAAVLRDMKPIWFLAAIALYGLLFLPAAWRWHLALRLAGNAVSYPITLRISLIGHFLYTLLFGVIGGDTAKSALYARRENRPLPEILAAASLDRLMGFVGLILFFGLAFGIAAGHGGLEGLHFSWPMRWIAAAAILVLLLAFLLRYSARGSGVKKFADALVRNGRRLAASPRSFLPGVMCGFLVQAALSGVLALNLQAVTHQPVPWLKLFWTFPLISVASAVPVTVAGLGTRDSAALALLGWCGVAGPDAVAASMLSAAVGLTWTVAGGLLLWRETAARGKRTERIRTEERSAKTARLRIFFPVERREVE